MSDELTNGRSGNGRSGNGSGPADQGGRNGTAADRKLLATCPTCLEIVESQLGEGAVA